ncbi:hypothetical protein GCM10027268_20420 [Brachybacterium huguangmaarense]
MARRVQRALPRGRAAVIGQDPVRRDLLWEHDTGQGDTISLLETMVDHCLQRGRTVIIEGILKAARYQEMHERMIARHDGPSLIYYLDVSLPETLRRHALKPIAATVSNQEVASWYAARDVLGTPQEVVLPEATSEDDIVARILADLATFGESGALRESAE